MAKAKRKEKQKAKLNTFGEPVKLKIYCKIGQYLKVRQEDSIFYLKITLVNDHFVLHKDIRWNRRSCICVSPNSNLYLSRVVKVLTEQEYEELRPKIEQVKRARQLSKDAISFFKYMSLKDLIKYSDKIELLIDKAKLNKIKEQEKEL